MQNHRYSIILAGGSGTRLWPHSREALPKHLLALAGEKTLLQQTVTRILPAIDSSQIYTVTNYKQKAATEKQLSVIHPKLADNIYLEPVGRNTLPAIAWLAACIGLKDAAAEIAVLPADHLIKDEIEFLKILNMAFETSESSKIVLLGMKPTEASTEFGYIKTQKQVDSKNVAGLIVDEFVEKPDLKRAEEFVKSGCYFWNAGIFIFRVKHFMELLHKLQPEIFNVVTKLAQSQVNEAPISVYENLPNLSIDYGLIEKTQELVVIPGNMGWSDLGNWNAVHDYLPKDAQKNNIKGEVLALESSNNLLWSESGTLAVLGLKDTVVIQCDDVTFVANRNSLTEMKKLIEAIKAQKPGLMLEKKIFDLCK